MLLILQFMTTINQIIFHIYNNTFYKYLINCRYINIIKMSFNDIYEKCLTNSSSSENEVLSSPETLVTSSTTSNCSTISTKTVCSEKETTKETPPDTIKAVKKTNEIKSDSPVELLAQSITTETIVENELTESVALSDDASLYGNNLYKENAKPESDNLFASLQTENLNQYISNVSMMASIKQTYSLADMSYNTNRFYSHFKVLEHVVEGTKLWIDEERNEIQIDNGLNVLGMPIPTILPFQLTPYQSTLRYFSGQNRKKTHDYLKQEFEEYMKFLTFLLETMKTQDSQTEGYKNFAIANKNNINIFVIGLYNLRKTYISDTSMTNLIDSIICTFHDYREKVDQNLGVKQTNESTGVKRPRSTSE
mgnify:CR=1 FL=1